MTSSDTGLRLAALGAATPIGRSAWASAAAVRAGLTGFALHPFMVDAVGRPMRIAPLPWIDPERGLAERIGDALISALVESYAPLQEIRPRPSVTVLVNLPTPRPGLPIDLERLIAERVEEQFGRAFTRVGVFSMGHAGALLAMRTALADLAARPESVYIVAGADSYIDPDMLEWLEETDQMHGAGARNNAWGFIPGEGAGSMTLATVETLARFGLPALGQVRAIGAGRETELIGTGTVCTGRGLTDSVRGALAGLRASERVGDVYCDMNGDPYRADEYAFVVTRTREHFVAASEFVAPADCWGDLGAASAPLLMSLACIAGAKRYCKSSTSLIWASSVSGERGAALIDTGAPA